MISVERVYAIVRDICNKDQKGFVTPNVFNTLARVAQQNVYNEMFNELRGAVALRASRRDAGRDKSAYKMVEEDLSTYIRVAEMADSDPLGAPVYLDEQGIAVGFLESDGTLVGEETDNVTTSEFIFLDGGTDGIYSFAQPSDFGRLISMSVSGTNTSIEVLYDNEKLSRVLNSNISTPTEQFPVALAMTNTYQVFPSTIAGVSMRYYRQPRGRNQDSTYTTAYPAFVTFDVNQVDGLFIADPDQSINFDLPAHYISELVYELCELIGIRLRDPLLVQYALGETKAE
tara:strand:- start:329 stop:1189 length:861 start_codon:yes stop_codon:yes gene_type:complete